jgi:hypothetical protein
MTDRKSNKVLILVPGRKSKRGGITNYYYSIKKEFNMKWNIFYEAHVLIHSENHG